MDNYVALWSSSQQCFHIETLAESIQKNARAFAKGIAVDYVPLFIGPREKCHEAVEVFRSLRESIAERE